MVEKGHRFPYRKRPVDEDHFRKCGHMKTKDNILYRREFNKNLNDWISYPRCKQCTNRVQRRRDEKRQKTSGVSSRKYPCGHWRTVANTSIETRRRGHGRTSKRCRICKARLQRIWRAKHAERLNAITRKNRPVNKYESDRQCPLCGYTLRYIKQDKCVVCALENGKIRGRLKKHD
jgi:hypothetical protein